MSPLISCPARREADGYQCCLVNRRRGRRRMANEKRGRITSSVPLPLPLPSLYIFLFCPIIDTMIMDTRVAPTGDRINEDFIKRGVAAL